MGHAHWQILDYMPEDNHGARWARTGTVTHSAEQARPSTNYAEREFSLVAMGFCILRMGTGKAATRFVALWQLLDRRNTVRKSASIHWLYPTFRRPDTAKIIMPHTHQSGNIGQKHAVCKLALMVLCAAERAEIINAKCDAGR